jgi:hypothetical protein
MRLVWTLVYILLFKPVAWSRSVLAAVLAFVNWKGTFIALGPGMTQQEGNGFIYGN